MISTNPEETSPFSSEPTSSLEDSLSNSLVAAFVSLTVALLLVATFREGTAGRIALALLAISSVACASLVLEGVVGSRIKGWLALKASAVAIIAVVGTLYAVG